MKLEIYKMSELIKLRRKETLLFIVFVVFITTFSYFIDIGINSTHFVQRDFSKALQLRMAGDCHGFVGYVNQDQDAWYDRCIKEKDGNGSIRNYIINSLSVNGDTAYVQSVVTRNYQVRDYDQAINYELKKEGLIVKVWKISNDISEDKKNEEIPGQIPKIDNKPPEANLSNIALKDVDISNNQYLRSFFEVTGAIENMNDYPVHNVRFEVQITKDKSGNVIVGDKSFIIYKTIPPQKKILLNENFNMKEGESLNNFWYTWKIISADRGE